jgi:hypothetical protein
VLRSEVGLSGRLFCTITWPWDLAGSLATEAHDPAAARRHLEAARAILDELVAGDARNRQWQWDRCLTLEKLAVACDTDDDPTAARRHGEQALAIAEDLVAHDPKNLAWRHQRGVCHERLGGVARRAGDRTAARAHLRAFLDDLESLAASQPLNPRWQRELAGGRRQLAELAED